MPADTGKTAARKPRTASSMMPKPSTDMGRADILAAAQQCFLQFGYATSLNDVAAVAGVARQTVYNQFQNKEQLFTQVVQAIMGRVARSILIVERSDDLVETLTSIGRQLMAMAIDEDGVALQRLLLAEHPRHPEFSRIGIGLREANLIPGLSAAVADVLRSEMDKGRIDRSDADIAAKGFVGGLFGRHRLQALFGAEPSHDESEALLASFVAIFTRGIGYRPRS